MAHIIVEYSARLMAREERSRSLLAELVQSAVDTKVLPPPGIRARVHRCEVYQVAQDRPDANFAHIQIRIGPGRSSEQKQIVADRMFACLQRFFEEDCAKGPLALSLELVELGVRHNDNNLRRYLKN